MGAQTSELLTTKMVCTWFNDKDAFRVVKRNGSRHIKGSVALLWKTKGGPTLVHAETGEIVLDVGDSFDKAVWVRVASGIEKKQDR